MPTITVLEDFTRDEIRRMVAAHTGRSISIRQFYDWLNAALIPEPKPLYSRRDAAKLLFVASRLNRYRSLEAAKQALVNDLTNNPQNYPED